MIQLILAARRMKPTMQDQLNERLQAMRTMDLTYARRVLPAASSEEVLLLALHKARYDCTALEPEFRHTSAAWLRARGYSDMNGLPIRPEGKLPE